MVGGANLECCHLGGSQRPDTPKRGRITVSVVVFFSLSHSYSAFLRPCDAGVILASDVIASLINMQILPQTSPCSGTPPAGLRSGQHLDNVAAR